MIIFNGYSAVFDLVCIVAVDNTVEADVEIVKEGDDLHRGTLRGQSSEANNVGEKYCRLFKDLWYHLFTSLQFLSTGPATM